MPDAAEPLPARLTYVTSGLGGKLDYLVTVLRVVHSSPRFDLFSVVTSICCLLPSSSASGSCPCCTVYSRIRGLEAYEKTPNELLVQQGRRVYFGKPTNQTTLPRVGRTEGKWGVLVAMLGRL